MDNSRLSLYFKQFDILDYVIVYGSMGRGETPYVKNVDGKDCIYNDLDLILVTEDKAKVTSLIPMFKKEIKELLGVTWVDLLVWNSKQLRKKRSTVFYYDLCFKNLVIKGNKQELDQILQLFPQERISTYDFYCMYQTRMWAAMSLLINEKDGHEYSDKQFKSYQCAKALIAICDFILFSYDAYTPMAAEKVSKIRPNSGSDVEKFLSCHLRNAVEVKLNPDSNALHYFIKDESLVIELLHIYQVAFETLLNSKYLNPSLSCWLAVIRMDVSVVVHAALLRDRKILTRNSKRKLLNRLFELESNSKLTTSNRRYEKSTLPVLLKELSE
ncbi:hypothetical protein L4D20_16915 [Vibrio kyushuensis]|uniref:hypothetical protein n=1 Tax=Vibrio kyushuensis TaxID=2910249 RepID=UPI003D13E256